MNIPENENQLSKKIGKLSAAQLALLKEKLSEKEVGVDQKSNPGGNSVSKKVHPATTGQQLIWFQYKLDRSDDSHNEHLSYQLSGSLKLDALRNAFHDLVSSHESLRSTFFEKEGELFQQVHPFTDFEMEEADVRYLNESEMMDAVKSIATEFVRRPFDLEQGFPFRALLIRQHEGLNAIVVVIHHIQSDGVSMVRFLQQLSALYNQYCKNGTSLPFELPFQSGYWGVEEQQYLASATAKKDAEYWSESLKGKQPPNNWPFGRRLSSGKRPMRELGRFSFVLDAETVRRSASLSKNNQTTLFRFLLSTYFILLRKHDDSVASTVGIPVHFRNKPEYFDLIGLRMRILPLTINFDADKSFLEFMRMVDDEFSKAYSHQQYPYIKAIDILREEGYPELHTEIQTFFNYKDDYKQGVDFTDLELSDLAVLTLRTKNELSVFIERMDLSSEVVDLKVHFNYNKLVFSEADMHRLSDRWIYLIRQCLDITDIPISHLEILPFTERDLVIRQWNATWVDRYPDTTLHRLIEQQAELYPMSAAVVADDDMLTYGELMHQSGSIARSLMAAGVGRDQPVGILMERSCRMMVAMIGVMRAGGAILPLDIFNPEERIRYMVGDSGIRILLTDRPARLRLPEGVLELDVSDVIAMGMDLSADAYPIAVNDPSTLAYVAYTSGSTGHPKGAMVEHRNIVNRLVYTRDLFGFLPGQRSLQKSPLSFDVSITELFLPLVSGGAVVFAPSERVVMPQRIVELICSHHVSYVHFVPSMLAEFLKVEDVERVNGHLKFIRCGGESLTQEIMEDCLSRLDAVLYQSYGPAETAVSVTIWRCQKGVDYPHPPIGRPNANTVIYILDPYGKPVPPGVTGEIWIGGVQVGRGYINQPELTAERFPGDPVDRTSGHRFYRTGDLGRYMDDGNILFVGRNDDQVKINGQRVEPGEVTVALSGCKGIEKAVVIADKNFEGTYILAAYVEIDENSFEGAEGLRTELSSRLPVYMIPSRLHVVSSIPLTSHGKTDLQVLRRMEPRELLFGSGHEAPVTTYEKQVAEIWCSLLGLVQVGRNDNFFSLGGHSILVLRMISQIGKATGHRLELSLVYEQPTILAIARMLELGDGGGRHASPVHAPDGVPIPMSFGQRRMWGMHQVMSQPSAYHTSRLLKFSRHEDPALLYQVLMHMCERHDMLRTRLVYRDGFFGQWTDAMDGWVLPWKEIGFEDDGQVDMDRVLEEELHVPFDLSGAPLWRARFFRASGNAYLFIIFHHAIIDEWSMRIFFEELRVFREAGGDVGQAGLVKPAWRYADFAWWQHRFLEGGERERQSAFWREKLSGLSEVMQIPPDRIVSDRERGPTGLVRFRIGPEVGSRLSAYSSREGQSRFSVLFSAFMVLLHRYTGSRDIIVSTPISGRSASEWQDIIGFFLNTLPLRMKVDPEMRFVELSDLVSEELGDVLAHSDLPFEEISMLRDLGSGISNDALYNVMFTLVHEGGDRVGYDGFDDSMVRTGFAKNDLTCFVDAGGDEWDFVFSFDTCRFSGSRMASLSRMFVLLLGQLAEDAEVRISDLRLMDDAEQSRMVSMGAGPVTALPVRAMIHEVFERQVGLTPEHTAVVHDGKTLSYDALNRMANRWAHELKDRYRIKREEIIPVMLPKGLSLVTAILSVLKSGAAFLPIDPALPAERIRFMLEDSGARYVLTEKKIFVEKEPGIGLIDVDIFDAGASDENIGLTLGGNPLAYVLYTSGSTGLPKGVLIGHLGFVSMIQSLNRDFGTTESDRVMQMASPSFDISLLEIFSALFSGAALYIIGNIELNKVGAWINEHGITMAIMTPSFIAVVGTEDLCKLRILMSAGEAARALDVRRLGDRLKMFNGFGPTETTVISTYCCLSDLEDPTDPLPIGRPIDNTENLILDGKGRLLPVGMPGELHISGIGMAREYLNRPELNREKFIEHPFISGERLYKTGDLAFWNAAGQLVYLGRLDDQVKVRGYRIELDEVKIVLQSCVGIRDVVVLAEKDSMSNNHLEAYILVDDNNFIGVDQLRLEISKRLPSYMVPDKFMVVPYMPLNQNGKTDRESLRKMAMDRSMQNDINELPFTEMEMNLTVMWSEILVCERVGRNTDFFHLGGNSLHMIRIMNRVRERYGVEIDLRKFYGSSKLRDMALMIEESRSLPSNTDETLIIEPIPIWEESGSQHVYITIGGDGRMSGFTKYRKMGQWLNGPCKMYALPDPEALSGKVPGIPLEELARKYAQAILRHQPDGPYILLGECIGGIDAFAIGCALQEVTDAKVRLFMLDTAGPDREKEEEGHDQPKVSHPPTFIKTRGSTEGDPLLPMIFQKTRHWLMKIRKFPAEIQPGTFQFKRMKKLAIEHQLFDEEFYLKQYPVVAESGCDPFFFHMNSGWREGLSPSSSFNNVLYAQIIPGFDSRVENPILHFLNTGILDKRIRKSVGKLSSLDALLDDIVLKYKLLDKAWYLENNPDVEVSGTDPLFHYIHWGYLEKRDPSPIFNRRSYRLICPYYDIDQQNPILHFVLSGIDDPLLEKRVLMMTNTDLRFPIFDLLDNNVHVHHSITNIDELLTLPSELERAISTYQLFDANWYLEKFPDVRAAGMDPLWHYLMWGCMGSRDPAPYFNSILYKLICPDFRIREENPILHFVLSGIKDPEVEMKVRSLHISGEQKSRIIAFGLFDADWSAKVYPSPAYYGKDPFIYQQTMGWRMGRKPFDSFDESSYAAAHPDFIPGSTNPVMHMLQHLPGLQPVQQENKRPLVKQKHLEGKTVKTDRAENSEEIEAARVFLRKKAYKPGVFMGEVHMIVSFPNNVFNPTMGWDEYINGRIIPISAHGDHLSSVWEDWRKNVDLIHKYLSGEAP